MGIIIKTKSGKIGHVIAISSPHYMCHELNEKYELKKLLNKPISFASKIVDCDKVGFMEPWRSDPIKGSEISIANLIISRKTD